jgi:hypothetical protein
MGGGAAIALEEEGSAGKTGTMLKKISRMNEFAGGSEVRGE